MAAHSSILPGKCHGRGAWQAAVHGVTESDMTEHTHTHTHTRSHLILQETPRSGSARVGTMKRGQVWSSERAGFQSGPAMSWLSAALLNDHTSFGFFICKAVLIQTALEDIVEKEKKTNRA